MTDLKLDLIALIIIIAALGLGISTLASDKAAMEACQVKHSFDTCFSAFNR